MTFTYKQELFLDYLLKKIGFQDEELIERYKTKLESIYGKYYADSGIITYKNGYQKEYFSYVYSNSECISELLEEIDIKKHLGSIISVDFSDNIKISATDLSSFYFCPASFAINKSFKIDYPTGRDKRMAGINLHETLRLIDKKIPKEYDESNYFETKVRENKTIKKIKSCELIFSGHMPDKKFFENQSKNYIGQPDYIFKDPNGKYFVVEEKFKFVNNYYNFNHHDDFEDIENRNKQIKKTFFTSHLIQLSSYLEFIKEYKISYGVLIYWFYDFYEEKPFVHSVSIKIIKAGDYLHLLNKTLSNINDFIKTKRMDFKNKVNPNKCAACVVNKYCAHKTNVLDILNIPYKRSDLRLKYVTFPEELKKHKYTN